MAYQSAPASLSMESVACFASVGFAIVHADNNVAARSVIGPRIRVQLDAGYEVLAYTVALLRWEPARLASKQSFPVDFRDRIQHERKTGRPRVCDIRLRHTRRAVHGQAQGRGTTAGSLSRNFRPCARWAPGCRPVTNASTATTFNAFTRATITHCNGVCRIDCHHMGRRRGHPA